MNPRDPETQTKPTLDGALCEAIHIWRNTYHPDLTLIEALTSVENVRHILTEIYLENLGLK